MIVGVGCDLVRIARIEESLARFGERFIERVFTRQEWQHCQTAHHPAACLAKRFAAKEALVKAMGVGMREGVWFHDIEVQADALGAPKLHLTGMAAERLRHLGPVMTHVSLSDEGEYAMAYVVIDRL